MSPDHDITLRIDFSRTPHPQHRDKIREAFTVLLDSLFEHSADSAVLAMNIGGAAECRLFHEKASWIGRPSPPAQPPSQENPSCPSR